MEIIGDSYKVFYLEEEKKVKMEGTIRLRDTQAYNDILELLKSSYDGSDNGVSLDLRGLEFLNSSGINTISKFVLYARKGASGKSLKCIGSQEVYWQKKSLQNLQKLWSEVQLEIY